MNCEVDCMSCILSLYFSQQTMFHSRSLTDLKGLLKQRENKNKNNRTLGTLQIKSRHFGGKKLLLHARI